MATRVYKEGAIIVVDQTAYNHEMRVPIRDFDFERISQTDSIEMYEKSLYGASRHSRTEIWSDIQDEAGATVGATIDDVLQYLSDLVEAGGSGTAPTGLATESTLVKVCDKVEKVIDINSQILTELSDHATIAGQTAICEKIDKTNSILDNEDFATEATLVKVCDKSEKIIDITSTIATELQDHATTDGQKSICDKIEKAISILDEINQKTECIEYSVTQLFIGNVNITLPPSVAGRRGYITEIHDQDTGLVYYETNGNPISTITSPRSSGATMEFGIKGSIDFDNFTARGSSVNSRFVITFQVLKNI